MALRLLNFMSSRDVLPLKQLLPVRHCEAHTPRTVGTEYLWLLIKMSASGALAIWNQLQMHSSLILACFSVWFSQLFQPAALQLTPTNPLNLHISKNVTVPMSPLLYGIMFEDINFGGDGGLYGELLQNRAFQGVLPGTQAALNSYQAVNGAFLTVVDNTPGVSASLPNSLELSIPSTIVGGPGSLTVSLQSLSGAVYATKTISGISSSWKKFSLQLAPTASAPDINNAFTITADGSSAKGSTINFGLLSLFPPTFNGRENGMRVDLAELLAALKPSFWRFPGGNNIEGLSFDTRWKWNETIGPYVPSLKNGILKSILLTDSSIENRPGRVANWGYPNTDGLGLLEYLDWIEDLKATESFYRQEPILAIWSGIATANYSDLTTWPIVPEADLQPYIDDAINEIEFITEDAKTNKNAALRAQLGREEPYALKYIEVGNEDQFQPASYAAYRWQAFVSTLSAKFPNLTFIDTSLPTTALDPPYTSIDFHEYNSPDWFKFTGAFMFDNYPRNGTQFLVGEYAVTSTDDQNALGTFASGRFQFPTLEGSVAEAAFMTGMERNTDVVFAAAYAPTLEHLGANQWTPDLISFDAGTSFGSTSYYVQQLFSSNRGTHILATTPTQDNSTNPLYWVASHNNDTNLVFLKVANTGNDDLVVYLTFDFSVGPTATLSTLSQTDGSGIFNVSNTPDNPRNIIPVHSSTVVLHPTGFNATFSAQSVTVLTFSTKDKFS
ncbi:glycoside hydrolase [Sistotremastrum niveocremeum HHB9708]|uniref:non-reducing end alpha-L-arabinofuranosidase n=1 Tax=Sistotremastrum niveocremeum HHB9708 TaxID=1314777 RepID=A0A164PPG9_9AGAM|nr:glycoside hydrolase [Sistotremastrum niveocremeum HHB9708]